MCQTYNGRSYMASKDFAAYKLVFESPYAPNELYSYFLRIKIRLGKRLRKLKSHPNIRVCGAIDGGAYHFFKSKEDALVRALELGAKVLECTIPKGTIYIYGRFGSTKSICAETYIPVKLVLSRANVVAETYIPKSVIYKVKST